MLDATTLQKLERQLVLHEGLRTTLYKCTADKTTIGVGYNVQDRGLKPISIALGREITMADLKAARLTKDDWMKVLRADILFFTAQVRDRLPEFNMLNSYRQRGVIDFVFNLGTTRAAAFKTMIARGRLALVQSDPALAQACWDACAFHMMNSLWARQVDDGLGGKYGRADRVCHLIRTGTEYKEA